jgi:hypothetical protein
MLACLTYKAIGPTKSVGGVEHSKQKPFNPSHDLLICAGVQCVSRRNFERHQEVQPIDCIETAQHRKQLNLTDIAHRLPHSFDRKSSLRLVALKLLSLEEI